MQFIDSFIRRGDISFQGMRSTAMAELPNARFVLDRLYRELERGIGILDDEQHLNMYLRSFGKMHKAKLNAAFRCLPDLSKIFTQEIHVYDWGCGQGTASVCMLDYLRDKGVISSVTKITLVEPSVTAVSRAKDVIDCYQQNIEVLSVIKLFDDLEEKDFERSSAVKLHLFSNILDVDGFDLPQFIHLFQECFSGENYFVCVGPLYKNNKRVDEFIAATDPDTIFDTADKDKGQWLNDWTISLRVFLKDFKRIEDVVDIRRRIEEFHMKDQFFAGYILDAVEEEYCDSEIAKETELLYNSLSLFDVKSSVPMNYNQDCDSKLAVLANIISRGLPTKAPLMLENIFAEYFDLAKREEIRGNIKFKSKHKLDAKAINSALHIIDPRFDVDFYNGDMLESSFEKYFIESYLKRTNAKYLIQVLEPQRPLSTIVDVPNSRFNRDQRVDFALEIPSEKACTGFIVEIDGAPFHSNIFQRINDERRDRAVLQSGWDTYRIDELENNRFIKNWEDETSLSKYLTSLRENSKKVLSDKWLDELQIVLSPLAVARVERILIEAMMSGALDLKAKKWNIAIIERDVPCAAIAIEDLKEKYQNICSLAGSNDDLPKIELTIVCTEEFKESALHLGQKVATEISNFACDLCIDVSMLLRDNVDALPLSVKTESVYIIRSSHYKKRDRLIYTAQNIEYPPFVTKDSFGAYTNILGRDEPLTYFLRDIFRKVSLRPGQLPILSHILADKTTIGLLPTGGGKSLTYQLSCMLQPGVTVIVDPLVSLMVDQVRGLHDIRIDACECVNSTMNAKEKARKLNLLQNGSVLFMLLSPERFMMENFRESLVNMTERNHVYFSYGVIDEVHCVSEWGHDFRTSYLHLGRNMINFMHTKSQKSLSVIGLTATASFDVLADVERELTLGGNLAIDSDAIVRPEDDERPELTYRIVKVNADFDKLRDPNEPYVLTAKDDWALKDVVAEAKRRKLSDLLTDVTVDLEKINKINKNPKCFIDDYSADSFFTPNKSNRYENAGIVFCPHAHGSFGVMDNEWGTHTGISTFLVSEHQDLKIGTFVGGDKPSGDMTTFNNNELNVMVATKAFGMGIDKPNIRFTVNLSHPSSIESFVQEAGRGGRDKKNAISYVLYEPTEFVNFTTDKVNDIRYLMGEEEPTWLENYRNKIVLWKDVRTLCEHNNMSSTQADRILGIIEQRNYLESVDKDIVLWFHNNSFRGLFKEKVILQEMTDRILNVRSGRVIEVQARLRDEVGNSDISLKVLPNKNALKVVSEENPSQQYGYLFLDNLRASYNHVNFGYNTCLNIVQSLINILSEYDDHSAMALLIPKGNLDREPNDAIDGIYNALSQAGPGGYIYVTVSWENLIKQDEETFERNIRAEISTLAQQQGWKDILAQKSGDFKINRINDFDSLLTMISKCSNDTNWLRYHGKTELYRPLCRLFYSKRDKDDTDKAIYRMCCIGLVEDVTIDYMAETYELKIKRRTDDEYRAYMLDFFRKYYSLEQAEERVGKIDEQRGRNYLDKCLGYLTGFVYENLESKRSRAIDDMRVACIDSINERDKTSEDGWLKEFIHLYFNSKYAREGYTINGNPYSLTYDTDKVGNDGFDVVTKYIDAVNIDSSGSEVDNVKHLYGATLLNLRAHPDNAALCLLLCYCITFLGARDNEALNRNAFNGYINGFMSLYHKNRTTMWGIVKKFNDYISTKIHDEDIYIQQEILEKGREYLMLFVHEEVTDDITKKYLSKENDK